jgi:hypothetical protein
MLADLGISDTGNVNFNPDQDINRWDFIALLTKAYLQKNRWNLVVDDVDFNISDLDYNSQYAQYVLFAKEHGFIDYLLETQRWETYIKLNQAMTKHEAYYILSKVTWASIEYDENLADKEIISRGEVAQLLVDTFGLWSRNYRSLLSDSQLGKLISNLKWSIEKWKQIAALL